MSNRFVWVGVVSTVLYVVVLGWVIWARLPTLLTMNINEVGDFLAGAFGPMAILWLVLGFFQQARQLRVQEETLKEAVRPRFGITGLGLLHDADGKTVGLFTLINTGAAANGLRVDFSDTRIEPSSLRYPLVRLGDEVDIRATFPTDFKHAGLRIKIRYFDSLGVAGQQAFVLVPGEREGTFDVLPAH